MPFFSGFLLEFNAGIKPSQKWAEKYSIKTCNMMY